MFRPSSSLATLIALVFVLSASTLSVAQDADNAAKESYNGGIAQMQAGKPDSAITLFQAAISKDPSYVDAYLNLGVAYFQTKSYDKALEQFRKVVEKNPQSVDGFANLGRVQNKLMRPAEAEEAFRSALAIKPDDPGILIELGKVQYDRKT